MAFIVFAQKVGLSLDEIRAELAKLPRHRVPERSDWAKLSGEWKKRIRARIAELERLEAGLSECIGCGCLSLDRCALANPAIGRRAGVQVRGIGWKDLPAVTTDAPDAISPLCPESARRPFRSPGSNARSDRCPGEALRRR